MNDFYTREDKSKTEIHLKVKLPQDNFKRSYEQVLAEELKKTDMKGFRKGKFPQDVLEKQIKPALLMETFQRLAPYYVNAALIKEEIAPVAPPKYTDMGELETGKEVTFTVEVTIMPEFKLGKISKIKPDTKDEGVTKEDIENTIKTMFENNKDKLKAKKIGDAWAKEVGVLYSFPAVKTLDALKKEVEDAIDSQKRAYVRQAQEAEVMRKAIEVSKIDIPEAAIEYEAQQREEAFMQQLKEADTSIEDFTKQQNIDVETMKEMWTKDAKDALENDALLKAYADDKEMQVSDEDLKAEIEGLKAANKGRQDPESPMYEDPNWQATVRSYIVKQNAYKELIKEILGEVKAPEPKAEDKKKEQKPKKKKEEDKKTDTKKKTGK